MTRAPCTAPALSGFALCVLALCVLALSACAGDPAPAEPPAPTPSRPSAVLTLDADGVGRLGAETPFDTAAVRAALPPGFVVELRSVQTEDGLVPVAWALRDGQLVLEVYPDANGARVARIDAASSQVEGPNGVRSGQTFADLDGAAMDCDPGEQELSGRVVCRPPSGGDIRYVFAHAAAADAVPDDDQLATALLERLVWSAD